MIRPIYQFLLRLHPPHFRERFEEEMLEVFDTAVAAYGPASLLADGMVSLARQWICRPHPPVNSRRLTSSRIPYFYLIEHETLRPSAQIAGVFSALLLLGTVQFALSHWPRPIQTMAGILRTSRNAPWLPQIQVPGLLHPKDPMPSFEVATIKPWQPPPPTGAPPPVKYLPAGAPPLVSDRVNFAGEIEFLIESAYGLPLDSRSRILGGPSWIRDQSERYQITAKIATADYAAIQKMTAVEQRQQVSLMQQSLLADRFKFRAHIETRDLPRYALVVAGGGSKLEPARVEPSPMSLASVGQHLELKATGVTLEELAQSPFLRFDKRQIVDKTGLEGRFSFTLKFVGSGLRADAGVIGDAPELPTALQEQLGLKLVPETGPVEVVVIDHIERPSEN